MGYDERWHVAAGAWAGVGVLVGIAIVVTVVVAAVWVLLKFLGS